MAAAWAPNLATGLDFADADHRTILSLLDRLAACVEANEDSATTGCALNFLCDFIGLHFAREERLQQFCEFPEIPEHQREHADFLRRLKGVQDRYARDPGSVGLGQVHRLVGDWIVDHIRGFDARMGQHCSGQAAAVAEAAQVGPEGPGRWPRWSDRRFLVVDDNPLFCELMRTLLEGLGARAVHSAGSASEGLARLSRNTIDLLLCDWMMDGRNGLDFVRGLRRDGDRTAMVMVTGFATADYRSRALAAGADAALEKPLALGPLVRILETALR